MIVTLKAALALRDVLGYPQMGPTMLYRSSGALDYWPYSHTWWHTGHPTEAAGIAAPDEMTALDWIEKELAWAWGRYTEDVDGGRYYAGIRDGSAERPFMVVLFHGATASDLIIAIAAHHKAAAAEHDGDGGGGAG